MGFTAIYIVISVSLLLWLLLLLLIISKVSALNNRIARLTLILVEFEKVSSAEHPAPKNEAEGAQQKPKT
jgi:hypothetical protein